MNDTSLQLALRELRAVFTSPFSLAVMAGLIVVGTIGGPFGTATSLNGWQRLLYWGASVPLSYGVARGFAPLIGGWLGSLIGNRWIRRFVLGLMLSVPVGLVVLSTETISFGIPDVRVVGHIFANASAITLIATLLLSWFSQHFRAVSELDASTPAPGDVRTDNGPSILDKVPAAKRGKLLALIVSDHYVEVVTDKGTSLVLMPLGDAMRQTGGIRGVQIHRSHWVAQDAVVRSLRDGDRLLVELSDGRRLPVSRSFLPAVRQAGLVT